MNLFHTQSVYELDKAAVRLDGLSEIDLMRRAGRRVWNELTLRWPAACVLTIFAGSGNNGGDAFVVAIEAKKRGLDVQFIGKGDMAAQSDTARHFYDRWHELGGDIESWHGQDIRGDVIVDGLLGIGLSRKLDEQTQILIQHINQSPKPRIAIDIPSGLNANTGVAQPCAIEADLTVTFIAVKTGLFIADGPDYAGDLVFDDLGVSSTTLQTQQPELILLDRSNAQLPPKRRLNSHKNQFGHVLVIGGDEGMTGAASLAAQAALRIGAGMVSVLLHPNCVHALAQVPELMVNSWDEVESYMTRASVIVVGPGMGESKAAKACLDKLESCDKPVVVDASALDADFLNALATNQVVITPHPGEAARLLSTTVAAIQADRLLASTKLVDLFSTVLVLKGAGTIVQQSAITPMINLHGNPGMASAGMGDVLAGMIGGLMAQNMTAFEAAKAGTLIHAMAADEFARDHEQTGLIASDVIHAIPTVCRQLRYV